MRLSPLWALLVAAPLAAAPAPNTYVIKVKHNPDPGKGTLVKSTEKQSGTLKILDGTGKAAQEIKVSQEKEEVYTETLLERGDKRPKKFKKTFAKAVRTTDGKATPLAYQGRTVIYDLKDGKYQVSVEGAPELEQHVLDELTQGAYGDIDVLLPKRPVGVGDKWALAGKDVVKSIADENVMTLDPEQSKGDARFMKAYRKDGRQFGVIEATLKLAIKGNNGVTFDPPGTMDMKLTADGVIDGSSTAGTVTMTGKIVGKGVLKQAGQTIAVDYHIDASSRVEQSAEK